MEGVKYEIIRSQYNTNTRHINSRHVNPPQLLSGNSNDDGLRAQLLAQENGLKKVRLCSCNHRMSAGLALAHLNCAAPCEALCLHALTLCQVPVVRVSAGGGMMRYPPCSRTGQEHEALAQQITAVDFQLSLLAQQMAAKAQELQTLDQRMSDLKQR